MSDDKVCSSEVYGKSIVLPNKFEIESSEDKSFAKIVVFPIQQGFGITLGNALRRTLLSSIRGVAIDKMRIKDAVHEYCTIEGIKENVSEMIYNFRRVIFSSNLESSTISLSVKGPKKVYASDIKLNPGVKIINQDYFLFEITTSRSVDIEFDLCSGIGDVFVSQKDSQSIDAILFDKHFSPVLNVGTSVSQTRVDNRTDYDKLTLEVKTNGSISAEESFKTAVCILTSFLTAISDTESRIRNNFTETLKVESADNNINYNLFRKIEDLELSVRSLNCLKNDGIMYIGDLVQKQESDMLKTPNFGRKSLNELKRVLQDMGLRFGMKGDMEWPPKNFSEMLNEAKNYFN